MSDTREIRLEVEVSAGAEQAWAAVATAPGISSWYVPHTLEEREGGRATARFGEGEEMVVPGRVAVWDPPRRITFDGGEDAGGQPGALSFEWTVEPIDTHRCRIRLVNDGYGAGGEWDDQFAAMDEGWQMFLENLRLHMEHFAGRAATASIPSATWSTTRADAWAHLRDALGLEGEQRPGGRVSVAAAAAPRLAGTVTATAPFRMSLLVEEPAPGHGFVTAEGMGDEVMVSVWTYLYGEGSAALAERDEPRWRQWLATATPEPG